MCWCVSVCILTLKHVCVACAWIFGTNMCWCVSDCILTLKHVNWIFGTKTC